jgi:N-acetylglucosaminyldiphosphoundecaprenol N-acetyl-beta-D-mannosaminyltransferase
VLGVPVDAVDLGGAVAAVERFIASRRPHLVTTPNPEIIEAAGRDAELLRALEAADLAVPDGVGLVWAARRLGHAIRGRVSGIDLASALFAHGAGRGVRFFFLGASPGVAAAAAGRVTAAHPGLVVAGTHHGYFPPPADAGLVAAVRDAAPDVLLVGMGSPRQEKWLCDNLQRLGVPACITVGGAFDVLSGAVARAPAWVRALSLEWLYRLARDPRRWRRGLALPRFFWRVLVAARRSRRAGRTGRAGAAPPA